PGIRQELIRRTKCGSWGTRADVGVCPTIPVGISSFWENYVALRFQLVPMGLRPTEMHENPLGGAEATTWPRKECRQECRHGRLERRRHGTGRGGFSTLPCRSSRLHTSAAHGSYAIGTPASHADVIALSGSRPRPPMPAGMPA